MVGLVLSSLRNKSSDLSEIIIYPYTWFTLAVVVVGATNVRGVTEFPTGSFNVADPVNTITAAVVNSPFSTWSPARQVYANDRAVVPVPETYTACFGVPLRLS